MDWLKKDKKNTSMIIGAIALFAFILIIDLWSKSIIANNFYEGESKPIIKGILTFIYSKNEGASFGMFANQDWLLLGLSTVVVIAMTGFLIWKWKYNYFMSYSLVVIIAGAIGNLVDRYALGFVRDFIDYTFLDTWFGINFAICNIADVALTVGCVLLIIFILFIYKDPDKIKKDKNKEEKNINE